MVARRESYEDFRKVILLSSESSWGQRSLSWQRRCQPWRRIRAPRKQAELPTCNYNVTSILYNTDNNNTPFQFQSDGLLDQILRTPAGRTTL